LAGDLAIAQDFDRGLSGPPLSLSLSVISNGLVAIATGLAQTLLLFGFRWWAPFLVGGAWGSTHWLLRQSTVGTGRKARYRSVSGRRTTPTGWR
jgi:hypothetical protein